MQQAGQVGKSALHGLAESLAEAGDGFKDVGNNVDELEQKLAALQKVSVDTNLKAELVKTQKAAEVQSKPNGFSASPQLDFSGGALAGTFSANASRQLFSSGETKTVQAIGEVQSAVAKVETAIRDVWGRAS